MKRVETFDILPTVWILLQLLVVSSLRRALGYLWHHMVDMNGV
jgi:hypothetical protein